MRKAGRNTFEILGKMVFFFFLQQSSVGLYAAVLKEKWFINKMQRQQKTFPPSFLSALMTHSSLPPSPSPSACLYPPTSDRRCCWANRLHFPGGIMSLFRCSALFWVLKVNSFFYYPGLPQGLIQLQLCSEHSKCLSSLFLFCLLQNRLYYTFIMLPWIINIRRNTFMLIFYRKEYESMEKLLFIRFSFFKNI